MLKETSAKGIQVFYNDCCTSEQDAIKYALKENANNYASGNVNRLKVVYKGCYDFCGGDNA